MGAFFRRNLWKILAALFLIANVVSWGIAIYFWPKGSATPNASMDAFSFLNATLAALQSLLALVAIVLAVLGLVGFKAIHDSAVEQATKAAIEEATRIAEKTAWDEIRKTLERLGQQPVETSGVSSEGAARPKKQGEWGHERNLL